MELVLFSNQACTITDAGCKARAMNPEQAHKKAPDGKQPTLILSGDFMRCGFVRLSQFAVFRVIPPRLVACRFG